MFSAADKNSSTKRLKHNVIEAVNELIQDIVTCHEQIAEQAVEHIHQKYLSLMLLWKFFYTSKYHLSLFYVINHSGNRKYVLMLFIIFSNEWVWSIKVTFVILACLFGWLAVELSSIHAIAEVQLQDSVGYGWNIAFMLATHTS